MAVALQPPWRPACRAPRSAGAGATAGGGRCAPRPSPTHITVQPPPPLRSPPPTLAAGRPHRLPNPRVEPRPHLTPAPADPRRPVRQVDVFTTAGGWERREPQEDGTHHAPRPVNRRAGERARPTRTSKLPRPHHTAMAQAARSGKSYDPAAWAAQRRAAVERANRLRAERKGTQEPEPFSSPQPTSGGGQRGQVSIKVHTPDRSGSGSRSRSSSRSSSSSGAGRQLQEQEQQHTAPLQHAAATRSSSSTRNSNSASPSLSSKASPCSASSSRTYNITHRHRHHNYSYHHTTTITDHH